MIKNTDLNINSWLIKWGYMNGYLYNGKIKTTKFSIIYQWIVILMMSLNTIRFTLLLFISKESQISKQLGDWSYFLGPRLMINGICVLCFAYVLIVIFFFKFCTRNLKKMFYWLNMIKYNSDVRCFVNMNLNELDSKMFNKRILIFIITLKVFIYPFIVLFALINILLVFKNEHNYYLNYIISIISFLFPLFYGTHYSFGFPVILYLVSIKV